jgi:DNA mismatch endonuclease (patch repair protein)
MVDNLTREQRSRTMSRIRRANTKPELTIRRLLHARGLRFRIHLSDLPGCPDLVFASARVVVFVDGDFWHGWRFPTWCHKLAPYWKAKIERNRARDLRNFRKLRRRGWHVLRLWEHEIEADPNACAVRVSDLVRWRRQELA